MAGFCKRKPAEKRPVFAMKLRRFNAADYADFNFSMALSALSYATRFL